jgi:acetylornithine deacetylase/succinyl-diaminopimelate desuccinylase-like protein
VVLDACLDTAPFGDEAAWTYPPASGQITGGWLHGRGSSDSKAGAAIFAHLAARLAGAADGWAGSVVLLFDVDEHTGGFGGAKAYFEHAGPVDAVMIGYPGPGPGHVITGGRGVLRARVQADGEHAHDLGDIPPGGGGPMPNPAASSANVSPLRRWAGTSRACWAGPVCARGADLLAVAQDDLGGEGEGPALQRQRAGYADLGRSLHLPRASLCPKPTRRT